MEENTLTVLTIFFSILSFLGFAINKQLNNQAEKDYQKFKIERKKLRTKEKGSKKSKNDEMDDDEIEDFIESLPPWLSGLFEGAGINPEKIYNQDEHELAKLKGLIDKLPGFSKNNDYM